MNDKKKNPPKKERGLTPKQQAFVDEYLIDYNGKQAAIRAGYNPKSAEVTACDFLRKGKVAEAVAYKRAERGRRTGITADRVLQELARIGFADIPSVIDLETASLKPGATADERAIVSGVKVRYIPKATYNEETGEWETVQVIEREIKINDKMRALEALARHLGITEQAKQAAAAAAGAAQGDGAEAGVIMMPAVDDSVLQAPQEADSAEGQQPPKQ